MTSKTVFKTLHIIVLIGYSIATILFSVIAYKQITRNVSHSVDIFRNWKSGAIQEIVVADTPPAEYEQLFNYTWPGVDSGCDCRNVTQLTKSFFKIDQTTSHLTCSSKDKLAGCRDVPSVPSTNLDSWGRINGKRVQVYGLRSNDTWENRALVSGANCTEPHTVKCGKSPDNVFCSRETRCPITSISIEDVDPNSPRLKSCSAESDCWVLGNDKSGAKILTATRGDTDDALPLADLRLNEYAMCQAKKQTNISPGRTDFEWLEEKRTHCNESSKLWTTVDTLTEEEFFNLNDMGPILLRYAASNYYEPGHSGKDYQWGLYARGFIPWSLKCRPQMEALLNKQKQIEGLKVAQVVQIILACIINFVLGIILPCLICSDKSPTFVNMFNWLGKLLVLGAQVISLLIAGSIAKFLSGSSLSGCSEEGIIAVLTNMGVGAANAYMSDIRGIIVTGCALVFDIILFIWKKAQGEEAPYHPQVNIEVQAKKK